jgi:hypothetical protein
MKLPRAALVGLVSTFFISFTAMAQSASPVITASAATPPAAKRVPKEMVNHGDKRVDDYFWLREKKNADTIAYLKAENAYTDAVMAPLKEFRESLYKEMLGHVGAGRSAESADDSPTEFVGTTNGEGEQSGEPELEVRPRNVDIMTGDSVNACLYAL